MSIGKEMRRILLLLYTEGINKTNLNNFVVLVQFPNALKDEHEAHTRQDQREDDEDNQNVCFFDGRLMHCLCRKRCIC